MEIRKILSYNIYGDAQGKERYRRVCDLLAQRIDPTTNEPGMLHCSESVTYTSPRLRATSCIDIGSVLSLTELNALNEIPFALEQYCSEADFLQDRSTAVRRAFLRAFVENGLAITHTQLREELISIVNLKRDTPSPLCISHTFRMKLIAIYSEIGDILFTNPESLYTHIDPKNHMYDFGESIYI